MNGCHINRDLTHVRFNYFCQYFVISAFFVYINPILSTGGLSSTQLGVTAFLSHTAATISRLTFGPLADGTKKRHLVLMSLSLWAMVSICAFFWLPRSVEYVYEGTFQSDGMFVSKVIWEDGQLGTNLTTLSEYDNHVCWPTFLHKCRREFRNSSMHSEVTFELNLRNISIDGQTAVFEQHSLIQDKTTQEKAVGGPDVALVTCQKEVFSQRDNCTMIRNQKPARADPWLFPMASVLRCFVSMAHAPLTNLLDSTTYGILGPEKTHFYGRSRAFGSAGYVFGAVVAGAFISGFSHEGMGQQHKRMPTFASPEISRSTTSNYTSAIVLGGIFALIGTIISGIPSKEVKPMNMELKKALLTALRSPTMLTCLLNAFLSGLVYAILFEYQFFIFTQQFNIPPYFMGILVAMIVVSEIPAFFVSGLFIRRFGETICTSFAHVLFALRLFSFAFFHNYWFYLISDCLFGPAFPLLYNAFANQSAQAGCDTKGVSSGVVASMQALMNATLFGVSLCIGGFVWGTLLDHFTGRQLLYVASGSALCLALLTPLLAFVVGKCFYSNHAPTEKSVCTANNFDECLDNPKLAVS
ncbi:hypothetical protein PHET_06817 [Paragonimus heterotremus]|uniref:Major facilitator superfamily associated domain-containing protein n=1 Tax=Paragonimus heterotremus TaxID=100268 RepID=A0A8J4SYD6_9TREM|nr:hypothetical protein PHET_06817 [Paragonimus heterotremus]